MLAAGSVALKAPIYNPDKIVCVGMNYVDHCTEQVKIGISVLTLKNFPIPQEPIIFSKFASSITDPGKPIFFPPETAVTEFPQNSFFKELDFEVELAIVVGKRARRVLV